MKELKQKIDWEVGQKVVKIMGLHHDSLKALYRNDTSELLSIRSSKYQTFRNADMMNLVERLSKTGSFTLEGFSEFLGGKRILAYLRNNSSNLFIAGLPVKEYLLVGNSHDASSKIFIGTANTLIRCNNQFSKKLRVFELNHTRSIEFTDDELQRFLNTYESGRAQLYHQFEKLKKVVVTNDEVDVLLTRLLKEPKEEHKKTNSESRQLLYTAIQKETSDLGMNGWGLLNGVTWYTSHDLKNAQTTIGSVTGRAAEMNRMAFEFCVSLN